MKRAVSLRTLARETRGRERTSSRSEASSRAATTRREVETAPSRALVSWRSAEPSAWNANDLVGYYAFVFERETKNEDPEIQTAAGRSRAAGLFRRLLDSFKTGEESPRDFVEFAIRHCLRGSGYPSDRVPSPTALCYNGILLKKWRIRRTGPGAAAANPRRRSWEEG